MSGFEKSRESLRKIKSVAFTHGHLYVALSRITKYNLICFFTYKYLVIGDDNSEDKILLQNIVYPDLLTSIV